MSPTAKTPGRLVRQVEGSTETWLRSSPRPHSAMGPNSMDKPKKASKWSAGTVRVSPFMVASTTPARREPSPSSARSW